MPLIREVVSCDLISSEEKQKIVNGFKIITVEEVQRSQWRSGFFYQASEESGLEVSSIEEVTNLLNSEISKGISIESAWIKNINRIVALPMELLIRFSLLQQL